MHNKANSAPQAIILAAGRGSRLDNTQEAVPKCLLRFDGKTLLDHQLDALHKHGVTDICVVTGFRSNLVAEAVAGRAHIIKNEEWADTNSLYSFSLCREWVRSSVMVINCDVLFHPSILGKVLKGQQTNGISTFAYDTSSGADDEHMKVQLSNGLLLAMCKKLPKEKTNGENVGILCFDKSAVDELFTAAASILHKNGRMAWVAEAVQKIAPRQPLRGIDISDLPWIEIDFPEDLNKARSLIWKRVNTPFTNKDKVPKSSLIPAATH
ncbi:MAG: phosphocholine cytidylyltransferase family protein [Gammaproteobacteria bacterium]|nr:phosphocholine cytidylyltransferase family protein [Gammaproteobacteria bacterium]